jgi:hypothetical protein
MQSAEAFVHARRSTRQMQRQTLETSARSSPLAPPLQITHFSLLFTFLRLTAPGDPSRTWLDLCHFANFQPFLMT